MIALLNSCRRILIYRNIVKCKHTCTKWINHSILKLFFFSRLVQTGVYAFECCHLIEKSNHFWRWIIRKKNLISAISIDHVNEIRARGIHTITAMLLLAIFINCETKNENIKSSWYELNTFWLLAHAIQNKKK